MQEPAGDAGMYRPGLEVDREFDERLGIRQSPVDRGVEQAEEQRRIDQEVQQLSPCDAAHE